MKKTAWLLFLILTACAPATSFSTATSAPKLTSTSVPSSTPANTPTPDPMFQVFDVLQEEGISVSHEYGLWWLKIGEVEVPGAFFDKDGKFLHIQNDDEEIKIPVEDVLDRVNVVDGGVVIDDDSGNHFALFNPAFVSERWTDRWITKSEAISEDRIDTEGYIQVSTWNELDELQEITRALSRDFSAGAYLPPVENIFKDYDVDFPKDLEPGFNAKYPFGVRAEATGSPFMWLNFVLLLPNGTEGRNYYSCIAMEGVLNIDKSKGILKIGAAGKTAEECSGWMRGAMGEGDGSIEGNYTLPLYNFMPFKRGVKDLTRGRYSDIYTENWNYLKIVMQNGQLDPKVKNEIIEWLTTGMLPKGGILEEMIHFGTARTFFKY